MRPSFQSRLINGPFDDPGLYLSINFRRQAFLFDIGDLGALSSGDILKISHVFVTHTHIDHFIGFDKLLRLLLGRDKQLYLFGPAGFLTNISGKLKGYTWNLVHNYDASLNIVATEIHTDGMLRQTFYCHDGFGGGEKQPLPVSKNLLENEPAFEVKTAVLDHQIPCLGFAVQERFHVNILRSSLEALGLTVGPWLNSFKQLLYMQTDPDRPFHIPETYAGKTNRTYPLGELSERIARITPGQKAAYIADVAYTEENEAKIIALAQSADQLYIEAAFMDSEHEVGRQKNHLTARQAGRIARKAGVKQYTLFHHSPRYRDQVDRLNREAAAAFAGTPSLMGKKP